MSETKLKATPGPWSFIPHEDWSKWLGNIQGSYGIPEGETIEHVRTIACITRYGSEEEQTANAHLMEAARDMYEALRSIENDDGSIPEAIWELRNKALAKARGEHETD